MTNPSVLPLYNKLWIFLKFLYGMTRNLPKEHKYTLGQDVLRLGWECLDITLEANALPNSEKAAAIRRLSKSFDQLKARVRMTQELRLVSAGQFAHWQENYLAPIGNNIGSWLKWGMKQASV